MEAEVAGRRPEPSRSCSRAMKLDNIVYRDAKPRAICTWTSTSPRSPPSQSRGCHGAGAATVNLNDIVLEYHKPRSRHTVNREFESVAVVLPLLHGSAAVYTPSSLTTVRHRSQDN
jgi:hypothetical protein